MLFGLATEVVAAALVTRPKLPERRVIACALAPSGASEVDSRIASTT